MINMKKTLVLLFVAFTLPLFATPGVVISQSTEATTEGLITTYETKDPRGTAYLQMDSTKIAMVRVLRGILESAGVDNSKVDIEIHNYGYGIQLFVISKDRSTVEQIHDMLIAK